MSTGNMLLEDQILKQNIPGVWSRYTGFGAGAEDGGPRVGDGDVDEAALASRDELAAEDDEVDGGNGDFDFARQVRDERRQLCMGAGPASGPAAAVEGPQRSGPKGVIDDYNRHKKHEFAMYQYEQAKRKADLARMAGGAVRAPDAPPPPPPKPADAASESDSDDSDFDLDDDDPLIEMFKTQRLNELRAKAAGARAPPPQVVGPGSLETVDADGYLAAVNQTPNGAAVVVMLHEDSMKICNRMAKCLEDLAGSRRSARFVCIHRSLAGDFGAEALPALMIYRYGELEHHWVRVHDEMGSGDQFSAGDVEWLLDSVGVFEQKGPPKA